MNIFCGFDADAPFLRILVRVICRNVFSTSEQTKKKSKSGTHLKYA